jgi:hypothetical protein
MLTKPGLIRLAIAGAVLAGAAAVAIAQAPPASTQGTTVGGHITKPRAQPASAMSDSSKWSATTYEAATSEEHRQVLAEGKRLRVTGEVVDVSCYLQLGKHGAAHVACAKKCATNGQPIGLLAADHTLYLLFPEEHHPRRDGQAEIRTVMIPLMGDTVTIMGTATSVRGSCGLFLKSADLERLKAMGEGPAGSATP